MARTGAAGVRYPAGSARWEAAVAITGIGLCGAALVFWAGAVQPLPPSWWLLALCMAGAAAWAAWGLRHPRYGELAWHPAEETRDGGGTWRWYSAARPRGVVIEPLCVALGLGRAVLLRGRTPDGLTLWIWCLQDAAGEDVSEWLALRRALAAHADGGDRSGIFGRPEPTP